MIAFPNAKINLGLRVLDRRADGYHNIETIFHPVEDLCDILEIVPSNNGTTSFELTGLYVPGNKEDNLCLKTFYLLSSIFYLPPVNIHLHKAIPTGSGLGGGSSDAAFTIKMLNDLFNLEMTDDLMMDFARKLGSDCAFFIENKPVFAIGKGDQFGPVTLDLNDYRIEVITPDIHVNTAEAYRMIDEFPGRTEKRPSLKEIVEKPVGEWKSFLVNDFEVPVFLKHPELAKLKQDLYARGAIYASMSGSGSAVFGIFK
jgi:4-diphosphocytidyl-2-C-methyl-D-erythritol kinase